MINFTQIYNPSYGKTEVEFNSKLSINDLGTVPNGSIENIYCDILDTIEFSKRIEIQNELLKKVMVNGLVHLKTINLLLLSTKISKGEIDLLSLNEIMTSTLSVVDQEYMNRLINQYQNCIIEKIDIDNLYTHIVMKRIK